jgi:hypothetical protein
VGRRSVVADEVVDEAVPAEPAEELPWPQRVLDNLWLLVALSVVIPGVLYLAWGLWELAELPEWGGR